MKESVQKILNLFEEINTIPRGSKNETAISNWLVTWAKEHGFEAIQDEVLNVIIRVPATPGHEQAPTLVLQGHMDMVCEKTPDSTHDFTKDPIKHVMDGEWLKADKTTLGADNGIALAMAMYAAIDETVVHPPLELLFTIDEETGLTGAQKVGEDVLKGRILLNLDSEDEGVLTVGCAGGRDTHISLPVETQERPADTKLYRIDAAGMSGGHSGVDIKEHKANANIILGRVLHEISKKAGFNIADIGGGSAHNAIPRDAFAFITMNPEHESEIAALIADFEKTINLEYKDEPSLHIDFKVTDADMPKVMTKESTLKILKLYLAMPHGIATMSADIEGLVETSNNFATVHVEDNSVKILTSQRSSVTSRLNWLTDKIEAVARLAGSQAKSGNGYPSWEANMDSKLLEKCVSIYRDMYQKEPVVEIIHAGLECGIIGAKYDGMDMISYGPTIKNPHSPDEMMHVPSLEKVWDYTVQILKSYC